MLTVLEVVLLLETEPEVAEPPVVLSLTEALPLVPVWQLLLKTATLLLLSTFTLLELVVLTVFLELGPVVSIEPPPLPLLLAPQLPLPLLSIDTLVSLEFELLTSPLVASPAVVLWSALALPLLPLWLLLLPTKALLLFF